MSGVNLMSSAVSGLLSCLIQGVYALIRESTGYWTEERHIRRFFGIRQTLRFFGQREDVIVTVARVTFAEIRNPRCGRYPGTTGYGELKVITRLLPVLSKLYVTRRNRLDFYLSGSVKELGGSHLILLGGPAYNRDVQALLDRDDVAKWLPITARIGTEDEGGGSVMVERAALGSVNTHLGQLDDEGRVIKDFSLIIKMPNPYDRSKNAILIIGAWTHGVQYGAQFLTDMRLLRNLLSHRNVGGGYFCTLVPLNVHWEPGDLEPKVEPIGSALGEPLRLAIS